MRVYPTSLFTPPTAAHVAYPPLSFSHFPRSLLLRSVVLAGTEPTALGGDASAASAAGGGAGAAANLNGGDGAADTIIYMWSECKKCGKLTTPLVPMSDDTWKFSLGKFLEVGCESSSTTMPRA